MGGKRYTDGAREGAWGAPLHVPCGPLGGSLLAPGGRIRDPLGDCNEPIIRPQEVMAALQRTTTPITTTTMAVVVGAWWLVAGGGGGGWWLVVGVGWWVVVVGMWWRLEGRGGKG